MSKVLVFFVFTFLSCRKCTSTALRPLHLLSLLPYPELEGDQPSWTEGPAVFLSGQLAVDLINNKSDILPDYKLELIRGDSGCDIHTKVDESLFEHVLYNDKNISAIVGPGCSDSTLTLSSLLAHPAIEFLCVHIAGSLTLQDRRRYPNSFSTIDSTEVFVSALLKIIENSNWKNVLAFFDPSTEFYSAILNQLVADTSSEVFSYFTLHPDTIQFIPLDLYPTNCSRTHRIVIFLASPQVITETLCLFVRLESDIVFPSYQFISVGWTMNDIVRNVTFKYEADTLTCTATEIEKQLQGSVFLHYRLDPFNASAITDSGLSYLQFTESYNGSINEYNHNVINEAKIEPSFWATSYFDAVWSLALALNNSREEMKEITGLDLSEYRYGNRNATDIVRKNLLQLDFNGISGRIKFNKTTGFTGHIVDIYQSESGFMNRLEYYDTFSDSIKLYSNRSIVYIGDEFELFTEGSEVIGVLLIILVLVMVFIIATLQIISIVFSNHPSIRATNPKLFHCGYLACYLLALSTILYTVANSFNIPPDQQCHLEHSALVFSGTGNVMLFAAMAAITFRMYRIFVHYLHPGRFVSDVYLLSFIVAVTVLFLIIHGIISAVVTPTKLLECIEVVGSVMTVRVRCNYWLSYTNIPTVVFPLILTTLASMFALMSMGKITIKQFRMTPIIVLCYLFYLNAGIWILFSLANSSNESPDLGPTVGSVITLLCCCLVLLFIPPSLPMIKDFYNAYLKEHLAPCWQRTKAAVRNKIRMSHKHPVSKSADDQVKIKHYDDSPPHSFIATSEGTHGHAVYTSQTGQRSDQKDDTVNSITDRPLKSTVRVTIEVVEETQL